MPDNPGGPSDPDHILRAIGAGAQPEEGRLAFGGLRLALKRVVNAWHVATDGDVLVTPETFAELEKGTPAKTNLILIGRLRYALEEVNGFAELLPA